MLALRKPVAAGGLEWEAGLLTAHHRLMRQSGEQGFPVQEDAGAAEDWHRAHREFHMALVSGCDSYWRKQCVHTLFENMNRYRYISYYSSLFNNRNVAGEHRELPDAALARDVERASSALLRHLVRTGELALQAMSEQMVYAIKT